MYRIWIKFNGRPSSLPFGNISWDPEKKNTVIFRFNKKPETKGLFDLIRICNSLDTSSRGVDFIKEDFL